MAVSLHNIRTASVLLALLFIFSPTVSFAGSATLTWGGATMADGGAYLVPLGVSKPISLHTAPSVPVVGKLFFIPNSANPSPEFVASLGAPFGTTTLSWEKTGTYRLDFYKTGFGQFRRNAPLRLFAWLIPVANAQTGQLVDSITFAIAKEYAACCSSVVFLPGIEGSVLKEGDNTLWPPSILKLFQDDVARLALTESGESINPIVVDGIMNSFYGTPIYSGFSSFMNELATTNPATGTSTIAAWKPLAYDWRYPPEKIITEGIKTPSSILAPVGEIETLAAHSLTGKVTLVAHSYGGLVGKALIKALQDKGEAGLIDAFVMVGVPQLGTPQAAAGLLHGDDMAIPGGFLLPGIIVNPATAKRISQNMQSAYAILPSPEYFNRVASSTIIFDPAASFTKEWRAYFGDTINTYTNFFLFIVGGGVPRTPPDTQELQKPEVLDETLAVNAKNFHGTYDLFAFPPSMRVVQVAGWGLPTTKAIRYTNEFFLPNYETVFTVEGDKTVVYPSAISSATETYFFDLELYKEPDNTKTQHRDLLNTPPVQTVIHSVIKKEGISETNFISQIKPESSNVSKKLVVSTHSPVVLSAQDSNGNFAGVNPGQDPADGFLFVSENIPGSTFISSGGSEYLFLPKSGSYDFVINGTGEGRATVKIQNFANDATADLAIYSNIPVSTTTRATFSVADSSVANVVVSVDSDGDGQTNWYMPADGFELTLDELLTNLRDAIKNLSLNTQIKNLFLNETEKIQKRIEQGKTKQAKVLAKVLEIQITRYGRARHIGGQEMQGILALLMRIENQL